jgi:uncharacterized protein (TIGR04255 family)
MPRGAAVPQEVYPNAPIALTACEVRFPPGGLPILDADVADLAHLLGDVLPIVQSQQRQQVTVDINQGRAKPPSVIAERIVQLTDRIQSIVVQVAPESVVIKTADYQGWDRFRPLLGRVLRATRDVPDPNGYVRVGLRYIDEIRLPEGGGEVVDWSGYLNEALLAPAALSVADAMLVPSGWQTIVQFEAGPQHTVVVRYGPGDGHAVNPAEPPRRPRTPALGPYFLLDIDSYWEAGGTIPEFDPDEIAALCDRLHRPVRALFDATVTDRLRDDVLRKEPDPV